MSRKRHSKLSDSLRHCLPSNQVSQANKYDRRKYKAVGHSVVFLLSLFVFEIKRKGQMCFSKNSMWESFIWQMYATIVVQVVKLDGSHAHN